MFKHLLVPTDGTDFSLAAVRRAVSFASDAGARITFLHVEHAFPALYCGEGAIMDAILKGADANTAATDWLKANPGVVTPWLAGVTTFDGGDAAAAVKTAIGG